MIQKVRDIKPFPLRMPKELRCWYENQAEKNRRSLNFIIIEALEKRRNEIYENV